MHIEYCDTAPLKLVIKLILHTGFLIAGVPSGNKMYRTSAIAQVHAAVHLLKKSEGTRCTLPTEYTLCC
jgi:hypothetical protein